MTENEREYDAMTAWDLLARLSPSSRAEVALYIRDTFRDEIRKRLAEQVPEGEYDADKD